MTIPRRWCCNAEVCDAADVAELEAEVTRLREAGFDVDRVLVWWYSEPRKPAHLAFTAGPERQVAYLMELAAKPEKPPTF